MPMSPTIYSIMSLFSVVIFACIHLWAEKLRNLSSAFHSRFLSTGGGVAIAYVFIDLLPKLSKSEMVVKNSMLQSLPFFESHVYIMALLGFLLFFTVDRSKKLFQNQSYYFWLSLCSYASFNFLMGYAIVDENNPEVQPLFLFTVAMALHYFMNDYSLNQAHGIAYNSYGKWLLISSLFFGWIVGLLTELSEAGVALMSAFIGGGVIMNVIRHELPEENPNSLGAFLLAAFTYSIILLS